MTLYLARSGHLVFYLDTNVMLTNLPGVLQIFVEGESQEGGECEAGVVVGGAPALRPAWCKGTSVQRSSCLCPAHSCLSPGGCFHLN